MKIYSINQQLELLLFFVAFIVCQTQSEAQETELIDWDYREQGEDWKHNEQWNCHNGGQSPINIDPVAAVYNKKYNFVIDSFSEEFNGKISFENHTIKALFPIISFRANDQTGFEKKYECLQINFHWPSEHSIGNAKSPLEMHIVCKDLTQFKKYGVFAIMVDLGAQSNQLIKSFVYGAQEIKEYDKRTPLTFNFKDVLLNELKNTNERLFYYSYEGSFTTPPCLGEVNWYILSKKMMVSQEDLNVFISLWNSKYPNQAGNFREIQPKSQNQRVIMGDFLPDDSNESWDDQQQTPQLTQIKQKISQRRNRKQQQ